MALTLLFVSSRTLNRNEVYYYLQTDPVSGRVVVEEPIVVEWVMFEKDQSGQSREPLTLMEKELLYGPTILKTEFSPPRLMFIIKGLPEFVMTVFKRGSQWVAGVKLPSGQLVILDRVHGLMTNINSPTPHITALEVYGKNIHGDGVQETVPINRTLTA